MSFSAWRWFSLVGCLLGLFGCAAPRPSSLPGDEPWILAIKSARLPDSRPWITRLAYHVWFEVKRGDESSWRRYEVTDFDDGVGIDDIPESLARSDHRFDREVLLVEHWTGSEAQRMAEDLHRFAESYEDDGNYRAFPGPNSNTFAARAMRSIDGLSAVLHHNAIGKDYTPLVRVGGTTSGTGVAIDTIPLGFAVAVEEGLELHLIQLTFGIALFPPALKIPFAPKIGF
ncbi:MAG: DUF3750 domain-containing protein [Planctomycetes bacterium]|nr:DUF3750 domain-containing protein [Planctomycetota bacterium]